MAQNVQGYSLPPLPLVQLLPAWRRWRGLSRSTPTPAFASFTSGQLRRTNNEENTMTIFKIALLMNAIARLIAAIAEFIGAIRQK